MFNLWQANCFVICKYLYVYVLYIHLFYVFFFRLNVKVESKTEIQHRGEKEEKIPKDYMKNYA